MMIFPVLKPLNRLANIADSRELGYAMECFFRATGTPCELRDCDGTTISKYGSHEICDIYHRKYPSSTDLCRSLDIFRIDRGKTCRSECETGLVDCCMPIVVDGQTVASAFVGHFLPETQDEKKQFEKATILGLDPNAYLRAMKAIPVMSNERAVRLLESIVGIAEIIARYGQKSNAAGESLNGQFQPSDLQSFERLPFAVAIFGEDGVEYVNGRFMELSGFTLEEIRAKPAWSRQAIKRVREHGSAELRDGSDYPQEITFARKDGERRLASFFVIRVNCKNLVAVIDSEEYR